jgi:uncharacterized membrane protein (UPF0127 family)/Flp pilus assembly protein protease CpaA
MNGTLLAPGGQVVCRRLSIAETPRTRTRGLLGRRSLEPGEGLLLRPANSVHTAFMRFAIDVVFLDEELGVVDVVAGLVPWRIAARRRARVVLELPAGVAAGRGIRAGMQLKLGKRSDLPPVRGSATKGETGQLAVAPVAAPPVAMPARPADPYGWLLAAGLTAAALAHFGLTPRGVLAAFFLGVLGLLSVIDIRRRVLPNRIVLPSAAVVLAAQVAVSPDRALEWMLAAAGTFLALLFLALIRPGGLGMGDVKLGLLLGAGLGGDVVAGVALGFAAAWPVAIWLLIRHGREGLKRSIPFGPALAFGATVALFASDAPL